MPPANSFRSGLPGWLILMGALTAIGPFAIDMYLPAFPTIAANLGVPRGDVERTLAAYLIGLAMAQVFYGPMADRYGRKPPLLVGLTLFMIASLGCALSGSVEALTGWRVVQAMGGAAGIVIPRAVIRDHYETHEAARAMSLLMLIMGLAPILAPLAGGQLLAITSWRSLFWVMLAGGAMLMAAVILIMKESLAPERVVPLRWETILRNYRDLFAHRGFMAHSLAGGFGQAGMFAYIIGSPRVFIELYGVPPQYYGLLFGTNALSLIVCSQISARLLRTYTPRQLQRRALTSLACASLAAVALTLVGWMTLPLLMLCLISYMGSQGFVNPNSAALALSDQGKRLGAASALLGTLQLSCGALAGFAVSAWQTDSALPLTTTLATCACLSWISGRVAQSHAS
ncbi:Bicyclomycin resistance protein [Achromobacter anxifer]|jgi:DHA1 family bicyclomycin/chloramphenicol resistance-like MFS transporter|uniref:Bcr/CflA family efflux transporter n=2 Tax=Achromobacter anxifer TaxID=1287737 RepID=A0A6S7DT17_9BURK|nr:Bicyclomycin resistance protein [Achromobacter anxifer]CAB5516737.1 Bicyclomycin resistance protein [Achromobacter anxifer]